MRILALDVGDERIGLAASDEGGRIARPLEVIPRVRGNASFLHICRLIDELGIELLVAGWPLLPDGSEGAQVRSVQAYLRGLAVYTQLPVVQWDERLSTREADAIMQANPLGRRAQKKRRDAVAAAVILQQYLNHRAEKVET